MRSKTFLIAVPWLILLAPAAWGIGMGGGGRVNTNKSYSFLQTQTAPEWASSAADNTHFLNVNNSTSHKSNPSTGDIDTIAGLPWIYNGSWVRILLAGETTLPTQTGNSGKYLTTNGTTASWGTIAAGSGIAISTAIPTDAGAAYLNDSTHVLTVASTTGYTQFTGSFTAWDTTPAAFAFTDLTDVALSTEQTATPVQITGINYPSAVTASGGTAAICTGATTGTCGTFSASPGNITANQYVSARHTSSGSNSTAVDTTVSIGGMSDVFRSTTVAGTTAYTDDFNRSDGALGSNWTTTTNASAPQISSNGVVGVLASKSSAYYSAYSFNANQYAQSKIVTAGNGIGPCVRISSSTLTGYCFMSKGGIYRVMKVVGGSESQLGSDYAGDADGKTIKLAVSGTSTVTLTPYINGVEQTQVTDSSSTITTGQPGFYGWTNTTKIDDFEAADL